jgi:hypothetical protein
LGVDLATTVEGENVDNLKAFYEAEAEVGVLRAAFPPQYWDTVQPLEFDFIKTSCGEGIAEFATFLDCCGGIVPNRDC